MTSSAAYLQYRKRIYCDIHIQHLTIIYSYNEYVPMRNKLLLMKYGNNFSILHKLYYITTKVNFAHWWYIKHRKSSYNWCYTRSTSQWCLNYGRWSESHATWDPAGPIGHWQSRRGDQHPGRASGWAGEHSCPVGCSPGWLSGSCPSCLHTGCPSPDLQYTCKHPHSK